MPGEDILSYMITAHDLASPVFKAFSVQVDAMTKQVRASLLELNKTLAEQQLQMDKMATGSKAMTAEQSKSAKAMDASALSAAGLTTKERDLTAEVKGGTSELAKHSTAADNAATAAANFGGKTRAASTEVKTATTEIEKHKGAFEQAGYALSGFSGQLGPMGSSLDSAAKHAALFRSQGIDYVAAGLVGGGAAAVVYGVKMASMFETLGRSIQQQTGASSKATQGLLADVKQVATESPASYQAIAAAVGAQYKLFGDNNAMIQKNTDLFLAFSDKAGTQVTPTIVQLNQAMKLWHPVGMSVVDMMDQLTNLAQTTQQPLGNYLSIISKYGPSLQAMGLSFGQTVGLFDAFAKAGVSTSMVGRGLTTVMTKAETAIKAANTAAADGPVKLQGYGLAVDSAQISVNKLSGELQSGKGNQQELNDQMTVAQGRLDAAKAKYDLYSTALKNNADAHQTVTQVVGKELTAIEDAKTKSDALNLSVQDFGGRLGPQMSDALYHNRDALNAMQKSLGDAKGKTEQLAAAQRDTLSAQMTILGHDFTNIAGTLGQDLLPALTEGAHLLQGLATGIEQFSSGSTKGLAELLAGLAVGGGIITLAARHTPLGALTSHLPQPLGGILSRQKDLSATGGVAGAAETAVKGIWGMNETQTMVGTRLNPIAVMMAGGVAGAGASPALAQDAAAVESKTPGGVILPPGVSAAPAAAATVAADAAAPALVAGESASVGLAAGLASKLPAVMGAAMKGGMIAIGGSMAASMVGGLVGGSAGSTISHVGTDTAIGAGVGSIVPGVGTAVGAGVGAGVGVLTSLLSGNTTSDAMTRLDTEIKTAAGQDNIAQLLKLSQVATQAGDKLNSMGASGGQAFLTLGQQVHTAAMQMSASASNAADALAGPLQNSLTQLSSQYGFPAVSKAMDNTSLDVAQKSKDVITALTQIADQGTGPMAKNATAALDGLKATYRTDLNAMSTQTVGAMSTIATQVTDGSQTAAKQGAVYMSDFATSVGNAMAAGAVATGAGTQQIVKTLNDSLKALGQKQLTAIQVGVVTASASEVGQVAAGYLPHGATGMRVTSPQYMVGEEAPTHPEYVLATNPAYRQRNLGLFAAAGRDLGVRGFASGGYTGYSLPVPRTMMGNTSSWSTDQGVDIPGGAGGEPEYAIGPGTIVGEGISGFGPNAPILRISAGPLAGRSVYYGHAGPDLLPVGSQVRAGQQISSVGQGIVGVSTGPHIEFGFYPPTTGGGVAMEGVLRQLLGSAGVTGVGGGGGGGVPQIVAPKVGGTGSIAALVRGALANTAKASNAYLQAHTPMASGLGAAGVSGSYSSAGGSGTISTSAFNALVMQALGLDNIHSNQNSWVSMLDRQASRESGFRINPPPPHDINWPANPAMGLLQVTGSTFRGNAMAPYNQTITDPLSNIIASIRYIVSRYGHGNPDAGLQWMINNGGAAYAQGGVVGGPGYAGAFGDGGSFTAHSPTMAMFGDKGSETVVAIPHYQTGGMVGSDFVAPGAYTPTSSAKKPKAVHYSWGFNKLSGLVEYHSTTDWQIIHAEEAKSRAVAAQDKAAATAAGKVHSAYEGTSVQDRLTLGSQSAGAFDITRKAAGTDKLPAGGAISLMSNFGDLTVSTFAKITAALKAGLASNTVVETLKLASTYAADIAKHHLSATSRNAGLANTVIQAGLTGVTSQFTQQQAAATHALTIAGLVQNAPPGTTAAELFGTANTKAGRATLATQLQASGLTAASVKAMAGQAGSPAAYATQVSDDKSAVTGYQADAKNLTGLYQDALKTHNKKLQSALLTQLDAVTQAQITAQNDIQTQMVNMVDAQAKKVTDAAATAAASASMLTAIGGLDKGTDLSSLGLPPSALAAAGLTGATAGSTNTQLANSLAQSQINTMMGGVSQLTAELPSLSGTALTDAQSNIASLTTSIIGLDGTIQTNNVNMVAAQAAAVTNAAAVQANTTSTLGLIQGLTPGADLSSLGLSPAILASLGLGGVTSASEGTSVSSMTALAATQGGKLTAAQLASAQTSTTAQNTSIQAQIGTDVGGVNQLEAELPSLSGSAATAAQAQIAALVQSILGLQGTVDSNNAAIKTLTTSVNANTNSNNTSTGAMTGTVGYTYQGQNYVGGGMTSDSASNIQVGM